MSMSANLYCLTQMVVGPLGLVHKQVQTHFHIMLKAGLLVRFKS